MSAPDRVELIRQSSALTGIDFVQVSPAQVDVLVFIHHLTLPAALASLLATIEPDDVEIRAVGQTAPAAVAVTEHVLPIATVNGRRALQLKVAAPGGFGFYRLRITHPAVDSYFNDVLFSFKANCPSELDCRTPHECPEEEGLDFPVDYRARDFWSFRRALTDFASRRYPDYQDRLEADVGMVIVELLSAMGDEFAYANDRLSREHTLEEASQRRSLRHLAALVDYPIDSGSGAFAWIDVEANAPGTLGAGTAITDGRNQIVFELGRGLADTGPFAVSNDRNTFAPYLWDEDDVCLPAESRVLTIAGQHAASFAIDPLIDDVGKWVLLETVPTDPAKPERRLPVRVIEADDDTDPLNGNPITRIEWDAATPFELDLETLRVRGNLVPATSGLTTHAQFRIGPPPPSGPAMARALERVGANHDLTDLPDAGLDDEAFDAPPPLARRVKYLFPLEGSEATPLAWFRSPSGLMLPEVRVSRSGVDWKWLSSLIGAEVASVTLPAFTLDEGTYRTLFGVERPGGRFEFADYATSAGHTIRLGDGEFGLAPSDGDVFDVSFRLGNGRLMNVGPDTLTRFASEFDDPPAKPAFVDAIRNPLAAGGGRDPESLESIRTNAPQDFRQRVFRAVRPEDYAGMAERLPWVQKAGATQRWTGSWPVVFVTPDPRDAVGLSRAQRRELEDALDRVRQAGRDVRVLDPRYADIDLEIHVCVRPDAYPGDVKGRVLVALFGDRDTIGFFDEDHFTFGTPLSRGALLAAVQAVPGVRAVEQVRVRRRGHFDWRGFDEFSLRVAPNELIRVANDRLLPERGAVRLVMEGGA